MGVGVYPMDGGPMDSKPTPGPRSLSSCDGAIPVSGNRVMAQGPRTIHRVVLGIALLLVAATLSIVSPPRANAASAAFVQGRATQVTRGTTASLAFSKANTAGNLIAVYVVWDNSGTGKLSETSGNTYTAATARQSFGNNWCAQVFYAANILGGENRV